MNKYRTIFAFRVNAKSPRGYRETWNFVCSGDGQPDAELGDGMGPQGRIETILEEGYPVIAWDNPKRMIVDLERMIADIRETYALSN